MYNKKLLCIASSLGTGGAERQMLMLIELLNEKGIVPIVLTYGDIKDDYPSKAKMIRYNIYSTSSFHLWRNLKLLYYIFKIKPDVILSYWRDPNLLASIYKFFIRYCRVIVSERHVMQKPLSSRDKILYNLYKYVDCIISNSYSQSKELISEYPLFISKVTTIVNYTNLDDYISDYKKIFSSPINIVILARYSAQKNIIRFLSVIKRLNEDKDCPSFVCNWYGQNMKDGLLLDYYKQCLLYKKDNNLDNVYLNGYVKNVREIMISSDIVCLPSLFEGFSNSLSEAICLGKPIVSSNVSDNIDLVRDGWNGFTFDPLDEDSMYDAIKKMLLSEDNVLEFGINSRKLAESIFDKNKFIDSYINILYSC